MHRLTNGWRQLAGILTLALVPGLAAHAAVLYDTGPPAIESFYLDGEGGGGATEWTAIDGFTADADWNISELVFYSESPGGPFGGYISTTWSIWGQDSFTGDPLYTGTVVASVEQISASGGGWYSFTLEDLSIGLQAGNYWLGHHHDFTTEQQFTTLLASESGDFTIAGALFPGGTPKEYDYSGTLARQIVGSVVPVPAAVLLFGSALAGLGWMGRRD